MKVLFAFHSPLLYGAELALYELAKGLRASGLAEPVAVFPWSGPLVFRMRELGIPTWVVRYERWATADATPRLKLSVLRQNIAAVRPLMRLLRQIEPDLVVTGTLTIVSPAVAARLATIPHLWYVHEFADKMYGLSFHWGKRLSFKIMSLLSSRIIAASRVLAEYLASWIPRAQLRVLYYAVEFPQAPAVSAADGRVFRLLVLGHKVAGKRQEEAVRALAMLRGRGLDVELSLVGSGDIAYVKSLQRVVKELHVDRYVEFVDHVEDPSAFMQQADALVTCSRRESFGRVIIEAMKCGRPVVGARSGGTEELIWDGVNGLLYEPGDIAGLVAKIERLYEDREYSRRLAENASDWARARFTSERYVEGFVAVASEALADRAESKAA